MTGTVLTVARTGRFTTSIGMEIRADRRPVRIAAGHFEDRTQTNSTENESLLSFNVVVQRAPDRVELLTLLWEQVEHQVLFPFRVDNENRFTPI